MPPNLRHLVTLIEDLNAPGESCSFTSLPLWLSLSEHGFRFAPLSDGSSSVSHAVLNVPSRRLYTELSQRPIPSAASIFGLSCARFALANATLAGEATIIGEAPPCATNIAIRSAGTPIR